MNRHAVIATHHKTGTVWMRNTFRDIARELDIKFVYVGKKYLRKKEPKPGKFPPPAIFLNDHANFASMSWLLHGEYSRILHLVRDPRDVLISAMHYHRVATEPWLHAPRKGFGGLSYQQKLNSLPDDISRYRFELIHSAGRTVKEMCNWNYGATNCMECRYEELVADCDLKLFTEIILHLGFAPSEIQICHSNFRNNFVVGGRASSSSSHVRTGKARQWAEVFDRDLAALFSSQFGDALIALGYERDSSWVEKLAPTGSVRSPVDHA